MFELSRYFTSQVAPENFFVEPRLQLGQFFYTAETASDLASRLAHFQSPCCLCTPRLARAFFDLGRTVRLLDKDTRFSNLPGFRAFDLERPVLQRESFDAVVFDPVFIAGRLLRRALDAVAGPPGPANDTAIYIAFPRSRESELFTHFAEWQLTALDYALHYNNIVADFHNEIGFYGNRVLPAV